MLGPSDGQRKLFACWGMQREGRLNVSHVDKVRSLWQATGANNSNWILLPEMHAKRRVYIHAYECIRKM